MKNPELNPEICKVTVFPRVFSCIILTHLFWLLQIRLSPGLSYSLVFARCLHWTRGWQKSKLLLMAVLTFKRAERT